MAGHATSQARDDGRSGCWRSADGSHRYGGQRADIWLSVGPGMMGDTAGYGR